MKWCHPTFTDRKVSRQKNMTFSRQKFAKMCNGQYYVTPMLTPFVKGYSVFRIGHCTIFVAKKSYICRETILSVKVRVHQWNSKKVNHDMQAGFESEEMQWEGKWWWWSTACLLLRCSEFKSRWSLQFYSVNGCLIRTKINK